MIAKTTIGSSFLRAINYGAGYSLDGKEIEGKSELLLLHNIVSLDPLGIALEMQQEAACSRCKKPVWHSSLSWKPDENPTKEQMIEAANRYCAKMGADPRNHQIAVYQHHDKPHKHIHIYINRVPTDGSKALETSHNYVRNMRICKEITQELGFLQVEKLKEGKLRHVVANHKRPQKEINEEIKSVLKQGCIRLEDLKYRLFERGIECKFTVQEGKLRSSSYRYQTITFKGQDVGFSALKIQAYLEKNRAIKIEAELKSVHSFRKNLKKISRGLKMS